MTDNTDAVEPLPPAPGEIEHEVQERSNALEAEWRQRREILNADQLASLVAPRARYECDFEKFNVYFFTIDGVLNGRKVEGALFAGECMLVRASSVLEAQDLGNRGLRETVDLLHEEYRTRQLRGDDAPVAKGMAMEAAGRRGRGSAPGQELATLPQLKAIMAHEIGGLPWKW